MTRQEDFVDNGDGTVTDTRTGLMWKQADTMNDLKKWVNYQDCMDYVRGLRENKFAGYDDWRLPTLEEMQGFYDESLTNKDIYNKDIHISDRFSNGGGFSIIARIVPGRMRTHVLNLREGTVDHPDGVWTLSEASRAVRSCVSG